MWTHSIKNERWVPVKEYVTLTFIPMVKSVFQHMKGIHFAKYSNPELKMKEEFVSLVRLF